MKKQHSIEGLSVPSRNAIQTEPQLPTPVAQAFQPRHGGVKETFLPPVPAARQFVVRRQSAVTTALSNHPKTYFSILTPSEAARRSRRFTSASNAGLTCPPPM